ncbi:MAG: SprT family zinc-dependent metalloprotease, partial [bacterium]|nr:SprT family zinc-dependent metalloprotease [bacterium]
HVVLNDQFIYLYVTHHATQAQKQLIIDRWYRHEMSLLLPDLFQHWEKIIGVRVAQWGIKKMKTRWGSCNTRAHRIWLNLNLIQKNSVCLEYVLVHELVHLLEASHNQRFYNLMTRFMPQWRHYQALLEGKCTDKIV